MVDLDSRIPLMGQAPDLAGSLMSGVKVADMIMGRGKGMTAYQREVLRLKERELEQRGAGALTPYQAASLKLQRERLDRDNARASEPKSVSVVEGIRRKLASGEALSPGEQKVYDDASSMSAFDRFLLGNGGMDGPGGGTVPPSPASAPAVVAPPPSAAQPAPNLPPRAQGGMIPPAAVQFLKAHANNPDVLRQFQEHYGQPAEAFLR